MFVLVFESLILLCFACFLILSRLSIVECEVELSSRMVGFHLFGIFHLPHGVLLPIHRLFIVDFSEWRKAAAVELTCISHRFFIVGKVFADRHRQLLVVCPVKAAISSLDGCESVVES